jgi:hypothetical protein
MMAIAGTRMPRVVSISNLVNVAKKAVRSQKEVA